MGYEAAKTLANEATAYGQQGKTVQALERFAKAREMFGHEKNLVWPWLIDCTRACCSSMRDGTLKHDGSALRPRLFSINRRSLGKPCSRTCCSRASLCK